MKARSIRKCTWTILSELWCLLPKCVRMFFSSSQESQRLRTSTLLKPCWRRCRMRRWWRTDHSGITLCLWTFATLTKLMCLSCGGRSRKYSMNHSSRTKIRIWCPLTKSTRLWAYTHLSSPELEKATSYGMNSKDSWEWELRRIVCSPWIQLLATLMFLYQGICSRSFKHGTIWVNKWPVFFPTGLSLRMSLTSRMCAWLLQPFKPAATWLRVSKTWY